MTDALRNAFAGMPVLEPGHVWLAGAGPGDPGLLTLQALAGLAQADGIVHDALVDPRVLALAHPGATFEFAGKRGGKPSPSQAKITDRLIALARAGHRVLRLKGGDPCVFGRGGEEALALAAAGIPFRIIPGITSGLAALTVASIPATMRGLNQALILVTGHCGDGEDAIDWGALARTRQPIVLYMGLRNLGHIAATLMEAGLDPHEPVAVIASATQPEQRILLSELNRVAAETRELAFEAPAIIVIGAIVGVTAKLLALAARVPEMVA
ncbi:MAG: uroporphyrinogen-III C-methyltransferase [Methyloceanibacter sp.]